MYTDMVITKLGGWDNKGPWYSHVEYDARGNGINVIPARSPKYTGRCEKHLYDKRVLELNPELMN